MDKKDFLLKIEKILSKKVPKDFVVNRNLMQRGIADIIEIKVSDIVRDNIELIDDNLIFEEASSKRSIEDFQINLRNVQFKIDVKTTEIYKDGSNFSMPNLISIDRLRRFYENSNNYIIYIFVDYEVEKTNKEQYVYIKNIKASFIEEISWNCLQIQNLGKGQLQIVDKKKLEFDETIPRNLWLNNLKDNAIEFYDKLIKKTEERKNFWETLSLKKIEEVNFWETK